MVQELFTSKNKDLYGEQTRYCYGVEDMLGTILKVFKCDLNLIEFRAVFQKDLSDVQIGKELVGYKVLITRLKTEDYAVCFFRFKIDDDYVDISFDKSMKFMNIYIENLKLLNKVVDELRSKAVFD